MLSHLYKTKALKAKPGDPVQLLQPTLLIQSQILDEDHNTLMASPCSIIPISLLLGHQNDTSKRERISSTATTTTRPTASRSDALISHEQFTLLSIPLVVQKYYIPCIIIFRLAFPFFSPCKR